MDDLLTGDFRPVRRAPPPPKSGTMGPQPRNDDLLVIQSDEGLGPTPAPRSKHSPQRSRQNGLPRSASLPLTNGTHKKAPPPRPPPPKINTSSQKTHHPLEQSSSLRSGNMTVGMFGKLRGPPSRSRPSPALNSMSAPCTPVTEASLIDLSSPPGSPTTRSGSDGLSVNSFGSESSSGNHSSGFEDSFDPFGPIQEQSAAAPPVRVGGSSFFSGTAVTPATQTVPKEKEIQDPFDMLALRASSSVAQTPKTHLPVMQTQSSAQPTTVVSSLTQPAPQNNSNKPEQKSNLRPTIIRPKAPVSSSQVESAGDTGISLNPQLSGLGNIDWSGASRASSTNATKSSSVWDSGTTYIIDQTIPEEPPPLPPRPESEEEDHDRPHGIAEYDFNSGQKDDLDFRVGDVIQLLYRINDAWLFGRCGPKEGMFPQTFIKIVVPLAGEKSTSLSCSQSEPSALGAVTSSPQPAGPSASSSSSQVVTALYTFQAEAPEDLSIYEGNMVRVIGRLTDDWLYGECNGKTGQFPTNFVDRVPPNLPQM